MKNKVVNILIIISLLVCFENSCVKAAVGDEYTVGGIGASTYYEQTITYKGGYAGGGYVFTLTGKNNGETLTAYCIDPLGDNPVNGDTYIEVSGAGRTSSAYKSVFEQTCQDEAKRITGLKSMSYNLGETTSKTNSIDPSNGKNLGDNIANIYDAASKGNATYADSISGIKDVIKNATIAAENESTSNGTIEFKEISNNNGKIIVYAYLNGNTVTEDAIECKGYSDETCTYTISDSIVAFTITKPSSCVGNFGAYIIIGYNSSSILPGEEAIPEEGGETGGETGGEPGETGGETGGESTITCECTPRYFQRKDSPTTYQQLIACPPTFNEMNQEGGAGGVGGSGGNGGSGGIGGSGGTYPGFTESEIPEGFENYAYGDFFGECSDISIDCAPYVEQFEISTKGQVLCDENGKTVINFVEVGTYENIDLDFETVETCIFDGLDYYGNNILASELIFDLSESEIPEFLGENICDVYCTEDYELILPGPTAGTFVSDNQVSINSGSFFTIDEKIKDKTNVKCYGNLRYHVLVSLIDFYREKTIEKYNKYLEKLVADSSCIPILVPDYSDEECQYKDPDTGLCIVPGDDYTCKFEDNEKYDTYIWSPGSGDISGEIVEFGEAYVDGPGIVDDMEELEEAVEEIREEYADAEERLEEAATEAEEKIREAIDFWETNCLGWDYSNINSKIYRNKDCTADIGIQYYDEYYFLDEDEDIEINVKVEPIIIGENSSPTIENSDNKNIAKGFCSTSGCSQSSKSIEDGDYNHSSETVTINYEFENTWCNPYDDSKKPFIITEDETCLGTTFKGFPVSTETTSGLYSYTYSFDNLGHYFDRDDCDTGRINDVAGAGYDINDYTYTNRCIYKVNNCDVCLTKCIGVNETPASCDLKWGCYNKCKTDCVGGGCILDFNTGFLATYRTVSLNSFTGTIAYNDPLNYKTLVASPDNLKTILALASPRDSFSSTNNFDGSNWDGAKADFVIGEIAGKGEGIYDEIPEYSFTLTPLLISQIKEYNETHPYSSRNTGESGEEREGEYIKMGEYAIWKSDFITENEDGCRDNPSECRDNVIRDDFPEYGFYSFTGPALK